jgi:hypothetical protein
VAITGFVFVLAQTPSFSSVEDREAYVPNYSGARALIVKSHR